MKINFETIMIARCEKKPRYS
uniref:Uncharacterized protein n=1 Tax=Tetranychus urticae TaxID=32264 RepID=T1K836_TETUR